MTKLTVGYACLSNDVGAHLPPLTSRPWFKKGELSNVTPLFNAEEQLNIIHNIETLEKYEDELRAGVINDDVLDAILKLIEVNKERTNE